MNSVIMFPTNSTSLILGRRLISAGHDLAFFCPDDVHLRQASTIPAELKIAAIGLRTTVKMVAVESLSSMDLVIFPTLDVLPHNERPVFGEILRDLFRYSLT